MPLTERLEEARRVMGVCNACRYCEGFCAVFPAMERRRTFLDSDLKLIANLCHNCRACFYACQYAPPHEFNINVPRALADLKLETYREFAWPRSWAMMFQNNFRIALTASLICAITLLGWVLLTHGFEALFEVRSGPGSFYELVPLTLMTIPMLAVALSAAVVFIVGIAHFWGAIGARTVDALSLEAHLAAFRDVLGLAYMKGGGHGCNYPDDRFSHLRRYLHQLVFFGFLLCLLSTMLAAFYHHFLQREAPYPILSWPVLLGTVGGVALLIGSFYLLLLKNKASLEPTSREAIELDRGFLWMLFLAALTGLLLLFLRDSEAMGVLLLVHLAVVFGLFVSLPYGKFLHAVYGYAALLRNSIERSQDRS